MHDFSNAGPQRDFDVLPAGTLAFAILTIQPDKNTGDIETENDKGNRYLNAKLTVCEGPFAKRVLFTNINTHNGNSTAVDIGRSEIRSILEVGKGASAQNLQAYRIEGYGELSGTKVAVEVTLEPAKGNFKEKNGVRFLTPNPDSGSAAKKFAKLLAASMGGYAVAAPTQIAAPTWVAAAQAAPPAQVSPATNKPAWL
jgi:hypothetical protein